jgi:hypothetical protein
MDATALTKICSRCPEEDNVKPLSDFTKNIQYQDGHLPYCKTCQRRKDGREAMQRFRAYQQLLSHKRHMLRLYIARRCLRHSFSTARPHKTTYPAKIRRALRWARTQKEKICVQCLASKKRTEFSNDVLRQDGLSPRCKDCANTNLQAWLAVPGNRERTRVWAAEQRIRNEGNEEWHAYLRNLTAAWGKANPDKRHATEHRYRANKRSGGIIDDVDVEVLYVRDKGICCLCLKHVNKRLKFPHPMSKSVEHIIPVSKPGSEHSYRNTALAHLICNIRKNNRVVTQQMRLF